MGPSDHAADNELADFQSALLDLLWTAETVKDALRQIEDDPRFEPYADYVKTFDPKMLELGMLLTKKWGLRKP